MKKYLEHGGDINAITKRGRNLAHLASIKNFSVMLAICNHFHVNLEGKDESENTPLHLAVTNQNYLIVILLLALGAKVNSQNGEGDTALHISAKNGNYRITRQLLLNGGKRNVKNFEGIKPIQIKGLKNEIFSILVKNIQKNPGIFAMLNPVKPTLKKSNNSVVFLLINIFGFILRYTVVFLCILKDLDYEFGLSSLIVFLVSLILLLIIIMIDPGYIATKPVSKLMYLYEKFPPEYICPYCVIKRSSGTRHCFRCNRCIRVSFIQNYDHHCPWIRNCIGKNNFVCFFAFISFLCVDLLYCTLLGSLDLLHVLPDNNQKKIFKGEIYDKEYKIIMVICCLVAFFFVVPIWYVTYNNYKNNTTTYQKFGHINKETMDSYKSFRDLEESTDSFIEPKTNHPIILFCGSYKPSEN